MAFQINGRAAFVRQVIQASIKENINGPVKWKALSSHGVLIEFTPTNMMYGIDYVSSVQQNKTTHILPILPACPSISR